MDVRYHNPYELFAALVVSLIAIVLKFGDRMYVGATTCLVATPQFTAVMLFSSFANEGDS